jgi:hypothetical protein
MSDPNELRLIQRIWPGFVLFLTLLWVLPATALHQGKDSPDYRSYSCERVYLLHYQPELFVYWAYDFRYWQATLASCARASPPVLRWPVKNMPRVFPELTFAQIYDRIRLQARHKKHMQLAAQVCTRAANRKANKRALTKQQRHYAYDKGTWTGVTHCSQIGIPIKRK